MKWFSKSYLFLHPGRGRRLVQRYEERTVVVLARSLATALRKFENEAAEYARGERPLVRIAESSVDELYDVPGLKVVEVASTMRVTKMPRSKYLATLWSDLRPTSCDRVGWRHIWYNRDGKSNGCYNCNEIRSGQLWSKRKKHGA